mmetsp:Transcript_95160/g.269364  ORF Transcript_95160/g.269364 Transcript_95160/m.269364 type:complete len:164 (-) Transcript_95160:206-697(-)
MFPGARRDREPDRAPQSPARPTSMRSRALSQPAPAAGASHPSSSSSVPVLPAIKDNEGPSTFAQTLTRMKQVKRDPANHLRANPINMGIPLMLETTYQFSTSRPVQMANDPRWNEDLKKMDRRNALRNQHEVRMTAATPGSVIPEPRDYAKNYNKPELVCRNY